MTTRLQTGARWSWPVPVSLMVLAAVPLAAGSLRLVQLAGGPAVIPADDRFGGFPAALVIHIVGAMVLFSSARSSSCLASAGTTAPGTAAPAAW